MSAVVFWVCLALLLYVYGGYPLLLLAWSRLRPARRGGERREPATASVVICACNEEAGIAARIENVLSLSGPIVELVVASDGSTDGTARVARANPDPRLKVIEFPENRGKAPVLNSVVPQCRGEIVVFADVRQRFAPDAVARLVADLADTSIGAVSGELVVDDSHATTTHEALGTYWTYEKWLRRLESEVDSTCGCTGAIYAIRRELFRPIHGRTVLDDVAIPMLIVLQGKRVIFDGAAHAYDRLAAEAATEVHRKVRTLAGCYQLCQLYPAVLVPGRNRTWLQFVSHKLLRLICPFLLLSAFGSNLLWAGSSSLGLTLLLGQAGFYAAALLGLLVGTRCRLPFGLGLPGAFLLLNLTALAGLGRFLCGIESAAWVPTAQRAGVGGPASAGPTVRSPPVT